MKMLMMVNMIVWSLVIGFACVAVKDTGSSWAVGALAFSVCMFISMMYVGV